MIVIRKQNKKLAAGFSLIEVLIAITILSLLMVSVYTIIDNSTNTRDVIVSEDRVKLQFEMGLSRLERDLQFVYSPLYYESTKEDDDKIYNKVFQNQNLTNEFSRFDYKKESAPFSDNSNFEGLSQSNKPIAIIENVEKGSLKFLTSSGRRLIKDSKQSNQFWVRYQIVTNENGENKEAPYALTRTVIKEDIYNGDLDWDKAKEYIVLDNLKEFEFKFWDPVREKYVGSLKELNKNKRTPYLFKVIFKSITIKGEITEGERSIRVIWPFFNSKKALEEKYQFTNSGASGGVTGGASDD